MTEYTVEQATANIVGRTLEQVIRDAAAAIRDGEADPMSLSALILALDARFDRKAKRRAAREEKEEEV